MGPRLLTKNPLSFGWWNWNRVLGYIPATLYNFIANLFKVTFSYCFTSCWSIYFSSDKTSLLGINFLSTFLYVDPVVLACITIFWPGWPGQIPAVCYGHIQSATAGLCCTGGNEWHPEIPDPPRWPLHWPPALCTHLVNEHCWLMLRHCMTVVQSKLVYCFFFCFLLLYFTSVSLSFQL